MSDKNRTPGNTPIPENFDFEDSDIGALFESWQKNNQAVPAVPASMEDAILAAAHAGGDQASRESHPTDSANTATVSTLVAANSKKSVRNTNSDHTKRHHSEHAKLSRVWPQFFAAAAVLILAITVVPLLTRQSELTRQPDMPLVQDNSDNSTSSDSAITSVAKASATSLSDSAEALNIQVIGDPDATDSDAVAEFDEDLLAEGAFESAIKDNTLLPEAHSSRASADSASETELLAKKAPDELVDDNASAIAAQGSNEALPAELVDRVVPLDSVVSESSVPPEPAGFSAGVASGGGASAESDQTRESLGEESEKSPERISLTFEPASEPASEPGAVVEAATAPAPAPTSTSGPIRQLQLAADKKEVAENRQDEEMASIEPSAGEHSKERKEESQEEPRQDLRAERRKATAAQIVTANSGVTVRRFAAPANPVQESMQESRQAPTPEETQPATQPATQERSQSNTSGALANKSAKPASKPPSKPPYRDSAKAWRDEIVDLIARDELTRAKIEYRLLRKRYPDFKPAIDLPWQNNNADD